MNSEPIGGLNELDVRHPYYIYAPPYNDSSAGIRALYILADALNRSGASCYIASSVYTGGVDATPQNLIAPKLTWEASDLHRRAGLRPIVIYPEVVDGNPLRATAIVRYVLNLPGLLGGPPSYGDNEYVYGYGRRLATEIGHPDRALFIPAIDLDCWKDEPKVERTDICFYASKYRNVHGANVFGVPDGAIEITRNLADSATPEGLKELLRRSKRLYVFENTALAIEAPLCGCPVVMMPNPYLAYPIGSEDHGMAGIAWGDSLEEITRAEHSVGDMRKGYQNAIDRFPQDLLIFIRKTQSYRNTIPGFSMDCRILKAASYESDAANYTLKILGSSETPTSNALILRKFIHVLRTRGVASVALISMRLLANLFTTKRLAS